MKSKRNQFHYPMDSDLSGDVIHRKNKGFLTSIPCISVLEYGQSMHTKWNIPTCVLWLNCRLHEQKRKRQSAVGPRPQPFLNTKMHYERLYALGTFTWLLNVNQPWWHTELCDNLCNKKANSNVSVICYLWFFPF